MILQQSLDNETLLLFAVVSAVVVFGGSFDFISHVVTLQGKFGHVSYQLSSVYLDIVSCFITKKTILSVLISSSY